MDETRSVADAVYHCANIHAVRRQVGLTPSDLAPPERLYLSSLRYPSVCRFLFVIVIFASTPKHPRKSFRDSCLCRTLKAFYVNVDDTEQYLDSLE